MNSRTGCYVGCMTNDYEMISLHDIYDIGNTAANALSEAMIANRVSWFFGLKGPSLTLDTACSSSLYALHLACQSLRLRETNTVSQDEPAMPLCEFMTEPGSVVTCRRSQPHDQPQHLPPAHSDAHAES